jgi:hypothetical protein
LWHYLFDGVEDHERVALIERHATHFFLLLQSMLADGIMLGLARLADDKGTGKRTNYVLERVAEDLAPHVSNQEKATIDRCVTEFTQLAAVLKDHRNKRLGHNDFETVSLGDWSNLTTPNLAQVDATMAALIAAVQAIADAAHGNSNYLGAVFGGSAEGGQIIAVLRNSDTWRELRTREQRMTPEAVLRAVRTGQIPLDA